MEDIDKIKTARMLIISVLMFNFTVFSIKIFLFILTSSLVVLAYAIDTFMDTVNDIIAYYGLKKMFEPPDFDHPYGHAKYDAFLSTIIAVFILASAFEVIREIINRIISGHYHVFYSKAVFAILISLIIAYVIVAIIETTLAKRLKIDILKSTALHYVTDPAYTIIVLVSVYLSSIGYVFVDIILSLLLSLLLIFGAVNILRRQSKVLLDASVINEEELRSRILKEFADKIVDCYGIKSRTDGRKVFLELTLKLPKDLKLDEAHKIVDEVEEFIRKNYKEKFGHIYVHYEPT